MANSSIVTAAPLTFTDRVILAPLVMFLPEMVIYGALRYYLSRGGWNFLIYLPKIMMFVTFWFAVISNLSSHRINRGFYVLLSGFAASFFIGWYHTGNLLRAAYGLWSFAPMLYGAVILPQFIKLGKRGAGFIFALWLISIVGLLLDYSFKMPWSGYSFTINGIQLSASKGWDTFGVKRCAGFSRASYDEAYMIIMFYIYMMCSLKNKFMISVISFIGLLLTTSKTIIGIYIIINLVWLFHDCRLLRRTYSAILITAALIGICLPLLAGLVSLSWSSWNAKFLLLSFNQRLTDTWPDAVRHILARGNWILGIGIGGAGIAQKYFGHVHLIVTDNMYLHLYSCFGLGMFFLVAALINRLRKLRFDAGFYDQLFLLWGLVILVSGWTVSNIEEPICSLVLGIILSYALQSSPGRRPSIARQFPESPKETIRTLTKSGFAEHLR